MTNVFFNQIGHAVQADIYILDRFILIVWQISGGETSTSIGIFE